MEDSDNLQYVVVVNDEEQYSIWPAYKAVPLGWQKVGDARNKDACLSYIESAWADIRPKSLRMRLQERASDLNA